MTNPIVTENQNTGTTAWLLNSSANNEIQAYCNATSFNAGDTLNIYISAQGTGSVTLAVYRIGYYGGTGGCLKYSTTLTAQSQGYWDYTNNVFVSAPTVYVDNTTHLTEARWSSSFSMAVPSTWVTGLYACLLTAPGGKQVYVCWIVKGNTTADYLVQTSDCTDNAYNYWGGHSLYASGSVGGVVATKVSFDRPDAYHQGAGGKLYFNLPLIKWLERQGYNLSYVSDVDVHANPAQIKSYKAFLSIGHDEYWTKEKYDGVVAARDAGIGLAFLGANTCDTQIRMESGGQNGANRTVTLYRVATANSNLANDPYYGVDNTRVTAQWSDPLLNRSPASMVGVLYASIMPGNGNVAWTFDPSCTCSYAVGTGLMPGKSYGYDLVGYEFDKLDAASPANIQVIGTTQVTDTYGHAQTSNTTVYVAPSGALVFASGSIGWNGCLDAGRYNAQPGGTPAEIPEMQTLFANIMNALVVNHKQFSMMQL